VKLSKRIACITLDIESDLLDKSGRIRMFDSADLMRQYSSIVQKHDIKVTAFLVTSLIEKYSTEIGLLSQTIPIEFGVHSHSHERRMKYFANEVSSSAVAYENFFGVKPIGYRAPNGLINREGIVSLIENQFKYDASIFPSIRMDEYGYSNLHLPNKPFRFVHSGNEIIELPAACLDIIRLVFSMSYVKLLGLDIYKTLMRFFPLPDVVILDSHPYDYYINRIAGNLHGWKRYAHLRNCDKAFEVFEAIVALLKEKGYEFMLMSELYEYVTGLSNLPIISVKKLR
jgi:peptidoglycan/xylan/chitin deacetylase (PgdA/CDA1 family)